MIDGHPVAEQALVAVICDVRDGITGLITAGALPAQPTFFEVTTAAALELFRRAGVEVAVIEVGLGGRLDATNVITPRVTAITSIAFDHEQYLGHTLARDRGREGRHHQAGRAGRRRTNGRRGAGRHRGHRARAGRADLSRVGDGIVAVDDQVAGTPIRLRTPARDYGEVTLSLRGDHQIGNAVVAVRLLERARIDVPPAAIADGLARASWPGRLEHRRLPDGREMILDAAHNPAGAATLAAYLAETFAEKPPLVFAAMRDKDVRGMFAALLPAVSALVVTRSSTARSADRGRAGAKARAGRAELPVLVEPNRRAALAAAWARSPRIVVAGSIFLLGDVMRGDRPVVITFEKPFAPPATRFIGHWSAARWSGARASRDRRAAAAGAALLARHDDQRLARARQQQGLAFHRPGRDEAPADTTVYADDVRVLTDNNRAIATGNVVFAQGNNRIAAERAEFDTETRLGTFYNATGIAKRSAAAQSRPGPGIAPPVVGQETDVYFYGDKIEKLGPRNTGSPTAASRRACSRRRAGS